MDAYSYDKYLTGTKRYRSNLKNRGTIVLEDGSKMIYANDGQNKKFNNDSVGFWYHMDLEALVIGFRGTDTADPERFLGFVPTDYEEKLKSVMLQKKDLDSIPYNAECNCSAPITCKTRLSYEDILIETTKKFCEFGIAHSGFDHKLQGRERETYNYDIRGGYDIKGGLRYRCTKNSDCNSDQTILNASLSIGDIYNDLKHQEVSSWVVNKLKQKIFRGRNVKHIIFAGHSLGGSLAFYTYLKVCSLGTIDNKMLYFAGFNSGSLKNYDDFGFPTDRTWKKRCEAHRILKDIVSLYYGNMIPTYVYKRPDTSNGEEGYRVLSGPNVHGIKNFMCTNYEPYIEYNVSGSSPKRSRSRSSSDFFRWFNSSKSYE